MRLDSDGPVQDRSPSDDSRPELYERTCRDAATSDTSGNREKRARSPEFVLGKRLKRDALRAPFVSYKDTIEACCPNQLAAADGAQAIAGLESAFTAWVATQCERPLRQDLTAEGEARFLDEVLAEEKRELDAWCEFQVFSPGLWKEASKGIADTRWVLARKFFEGKKTVTARLAARDFQDFDLAEGPVGTSSCFSMRSSHLQVISLGALKQWKLRSLEIKNAPL